MLCEDTPEEAENMEIRAELMRSIQNRIRNKDWTQSQAAKRFGVTQPRISDFRSNATPYLRFNVR
jgi:predicted XRE-type DNA-binding protein